MSQKTKKNHFSPVFANKPWTNEQQAKKYAHFYKCRFSGVVKKSAHGKGEKAWGFRKHLYSQSLEGRLDSELENEAAILYQNLVKGEKLDADQRMKWGQFIITQFVRTPTFFMGKGGRC